MKHLEVRKMRRGSIIFCLVVFLIFLSGCAVLTKTQIKEVDTFAATAKNYSTLPGTVIEKHGEMRKTQKMLKASTFKEGETSLELIESALSSMEKLKKRAAEINGILNILDHYGDLLITLTSDKFTNEMQKNAETLGSEIDKGINNHNKHYKTNFSLFGSTVAAIVRGAAGISIKRKQSKALKRAVIEADPAVREMIAKVEKFLLLYLNEEGRKPETKGLIGNVESDLKETYKTIVEKYRDQGLPVPFGTVLIVADQLAAVKDTIRLVKNTLKAGRAYCAAHARLAESVKSKKSFKSAIKQIRVLSEEIRAARKLRK